MDIQMSDEIAPVQALTPKPLKPARKWSFLKVLATVFFFYVLGLVILVLTGNPNLFPTVVLLGSFMFPAAFVAFFYERRHYSRLTLPVISLCFFYGGLLGVFSASILEPIFVRNLDFFTSFTVGFIEEFVKILGVLVIARRWGHESELDGIILGAAAGMGFAALESTGYAFTAFLMSQGSLSTTVGVELLRGVLSPVGHGVWTAILAGVLFRESRDGHFRINLKVIGAYITVAILHGLWDGLPGVIDGITGSGLDVAIGQSLVGIAGLIILFVHWRQAVHKQEADLQPPEPNPYDAYEV